MVALFLDIDGVLNCATSHSECGAYTGIDDKKVELLKEIFEQTPAQIILTSSWKEGWYREPQYKDCQDELANYLDRKLKRQKLFVFDKIKEGKRAEEVRRYIDEHKIKFFAILDDENLNYAAFGLEPNLVLTDRQFGLTENDVKKAIEILHAWTD